MKNKKHHHTLLHDSGAVCWRGGHMHGAAQDGKLLMFCRAAGCTSRISLKTANWSMYVNEDFL